MPQESESRVSEGPLESRFSSGMEGGYFPGMATLNISTSVDSSGNLLHSIICACGCCSYQDLCDNTGCWAPASATVVTLTPKYGPAQISLWEESLESSIAYLDPFYGQEILPVSEVRGTIDFLIAEEWAQEVARRVARIENTWYNSPLRQEGA